MAARMMHLTGMITPVERRSVAGITPEFYFQKTIDNSRVVRAVDPQRRREIRMLSAVVSVFFMMAMIYAWQHFRSLEYGYQIEAQKTDHVRLLELNRTLTLEASALRNPGRIDILARQMNLEPPRPGQVVRLDSDMQDATSAMAQLSTVAVIPAQ